MSPLSRAARRPVPADGGGSPGSRRTQFGVGRVGEGPDDHAFTGGVTTAGKANGALDRGQRDAVPGAARGLHHGIQSLQQGPCGGVSPVPPGRRFVLAQEVAHTGSERVEGGASLGAGHRGCVGLRCRPSKRRCGTRLAEPAAPVPVQIIARPTTIPCSPDISTISRPAIRPGSVPAIAAAPAMRGPSPRSRHEFLPPAPELPVPAPTPTSAGNARLRSRMLPMRRRSSSATGTGMTVLVLR